MKQTAVEWLINKFDIILPLDFNWDKLEKVFEQAKAMEKEQIVNAYDTGEYDCGYNGNGKQYYNETYKK